MRISARTWTWLALAVVAAVATSWGAARWRAQRLERSLPDAAVHVAAASPIDEETLKQLCSHCHQRPTPDVLPQSWWDKTVWTMSHFGGFGANVPDKVSPESVARWYAEHAPARLTLPAIPAGEGPGSLRMVKRPIATSDLPEVSFVSHMRLGDLLDDARPELIVCDMRNGKILLGRTASPDWKLQPIGSVSNPAHVEIADLDADGRRDLVVANLGSFLAMDHKLGTVEWLRQTGDGGFEQRTLADDLGRVADVQPADIDGDGDLDLAVAEFGWRWTGHFLVLENRAAAGQPPTFHRLAIDGLHGCSHASVTDVDGDGLLDILALHSQEHELVRCYRQRGKLVFEASDLYRAPHPAWGTSGFQVVDLDGDGDVDILVTNGDTYDNGLLKPYHGVQWLENQGAMRFQPHELVRMYAVYRAEAGDLDGDGDLDIMACAMAEAKDLEGTQGATEFESILWLEQVARGKFTHRSFETGACHHPTLTLGDYDVDGDVDLFVGNGQLDDTGGAPEAGCVSLWENQLR